MKKDYVITILPSDDSSAKNKHSVVRPSRRTPYRARRIQQRGIYATLYDMGQLASGTDISFVFNGNPALNVFLELETKPYEIAKNLKYAESWNTFIVGFSRDAWKTTFKRISNPYKYGFAINEIGDGEEVADKGFPIAKAVGVAVGGGRAIRRFDTNATTYYKITSASSFSAAEVPFVLDLSVEVYLMPLILRWIGFADIWRQPREYEYPREDYLLNGFWKPIPRKFALNNAVWESYFNAPFYRMFVMPSDFSKAVLYPKAVRDSWFALNTQNPSSSLYKVIYNGASYLRNYESHTSIGASGFPRAETEDVFVHPTGNVPTYRPMGWIADIITPEGLLVAVIKKGNDWFYVWSKFDLERSSLNQSGYKIAT